MRVCMTKASMKARWCPPAFWILVMDHRGAPGLKQLHADTVPVLYEVVLRLGWPVGMQEAHTPPVEQWPAWPLLT